MRAGATVAIEGIGTWVQVTNSPIQTTYTSNQTLADTMHYQRNLFSNRGASGAVTIDLPDCREGVEYMFVLEAAQNFDINPHSSDRILGLTNADGDAIRANAIGDTVHLMCVATQPRDLVVIGINGTWTDVN